MPPPLKMGAFRFAFVCLPVRKKKLFATKVEKRRHSSLMCPFPICNVFVIIIVNKQQVDRML